ncbi:SdpA family antimicrobial peptide system protein [uncultured Chryseobacterium sp.]|uniref:SdpA family antimicrobial peptide system protein n=1 Tax=uncultured Chryseobacterium sp. TaxID=259322 RepID=UPI0025D3D386|nr:SdpA family antimicrobial peptide system protein [uncultured Chryseobacterium sp.]
MRKTILNFSIIILFLYVIFFLFKNSIGYNIKSSNFLTISFFSKISPQGWGFFTKNPREENVYIYSIHNGQLKSEITQNSSYKNFFGISKKSRMIGFEVSMILGQLKNTKWSKYTQNFNTLPLQQIDSKNLHYLKNGKYILIKEKVPPYTWRNNIKNKTNLLEIIYVNCSKK